jgi:transcription elongation factor Elf1
MSHSYPVVPRNEQHRCTKCNSRFEVCVEVDPVAAADHVEAEVKCPCCGAAHTVSVPKGSERRLKVENVPGPEPETGAGD